MAFSYLFQDRCFFPHFSCFSSEKTDGMDQRQGRASSKGNWIVEKKKSFHVNLNKRGNSVTPDSFGKYFTPVNMFFRGLTDLVGTAQHDPVNFLVKTALLL